jgi:nitrite reductase/ring-hydroxylating ferredoxin subunit
MKMWRLGRTPRGAAPEERAQPDWAQCRPGWIAGALERALARPAGGWFVLDGSRSLGGAPRQFRVDGRDLVAWRGTGGALTVGPDTCPHLGASLANGRVDAAGCVVCPWHGLALGPGRAHGRWRTLPAHDDGTLLWVRLSAEEGGGEAHGVIPHDLVSRSGGRPTGSSPEAGSSGPSQPARGGDLSGGEEATEQPIITTRPAKPLTGVVRVEADCEPEDVLANRLDPWHGVHFHPHSFGQLRVVDQDQDSITVRVVYKIVGRVGVEVDARFACPDRRTIAMTIVDGEGTGSVVETHATPIGRGRTAIIEATLATSERPGFWLARRSALVVRPLIRWAAHRLWREDAAYAERRYAVRRNGAG